MQFTKFNWRLWGWLGALFLVVLGAKLWLIRLYGVDLPYSDQWDEAKNLFKPWLEGHWTWSSWFGPHNEHRIFFTRALDVLELWLNGQWDPLLQMVINAFLHAGYACGLAYVLWVFTGRHAEGWLFFLLMPFFAFPFAAENTLHGFQSQMYFLGIFSVLTMLGLGFGKPWGGWWWCGWAAGVMVLFTMGSGLLAAVAVAGLIGLRMMKERKVTRNQVVVAGGCLAIFVLGLSLDVAFGKHALYPDRPFWTFGEALLGNLAWPFINQPVLVMVTGLPLVLTAIRYFRSDVRDPRAAEFVLTLGFWGFLQATALAYGRAHLGSSSRYMDTLDTFAITSLASFFIPGQRAEDGGLSRPLRSLLVVVWVVWVFLGMWQLSWAARVAGQPENYLQFSRRTGLIQEQEVRAFMATDDPGRLKGKSLHETPYADVDELAALLRDPTLRGIMPATCRPLLQLEPAETSGGLLIRDGCPPGIVRPDFVTIWGNCSNGAALTGHFVSQPLRAALPRLSLTLFCGPTRTGAAMQLVESSSGRRIEVVPPEPGRWQTVIVPAPRDEFRLEVTNQRTDVWVAIGEIQELGRYSAYALALLDHAVAILLAGLGLSVLLAGGAVARRGFCLARLFSTAGVVEWLILLAALVALTRVWWERAFIAG